MKTKNNFRGILAILSFALAAVLVFALAGCGEKPGSGPGDGGKYYTVTFKKASANADLGEVSRQSVKEGEKAVRPATGTEEGAETFFGWFRGLSKNDGGNVFFDFDEPITGNTVIYGRAAEQKKITVENYDGGQNSVKRNVGITDASKYRIIKYYHPDGHEIILTTLPDGYSETYNVKGFYIDIKKFLNENLRYEFESKTYTIKNYIRLYFPPAAFTEHYDGVYNLNYLFNGSYFEVKAVNDSRNLNVYFGLVQVDSEPDRNNFAITNDEEELRFWQLIKADGFRIKSLSNDAIELDGSMAWEGGYYYRLENDVSMSW
jgi:hypothetical protein